MMRTSKTTQTTSSISERTVQLTVSLPENPLLTADDVARFLQFKPQTVRAMVRRGELPAIKVGRRWRFQREKIEAWIQTQGE